MDEVQIRPAVQDDLSRILELYDQLGGGQYPPPSLERARDIFAKMSDYPNFKIYVATLSGRIVGTVSLITMEAISHSGIPHALLESLVVDQSIRGGGVGKKLTAYAMDRCRDAGCWKLCLSSNLARTDAHAFYEKLGFTQQGLSFYVEIPDTP